jgi:uncharacterized membrane protein
LIRLILETVIVPSAAPLQDTFVALADTVTLIGSPIVTVVVAVPLHQHFH